MAVFLRFRSTARDSCNRNQSINQYSFITAVGMEKCRPTLKIADRSPVDRKVSRVKTFIYAARTPTLDRCVSTKTELPGSSCVISFTCLDAARHY